jgi:hypothetical protein
MMNAKELVGLIDAGKRFAYQAGIFGPVAELW